MSKKLLIITIASSLLITQNSFPVPKELQKYCPDGCKYYYNCDAIQKKCVYKGFFPIYPLELIELCAMMISSALATACGIGGGTVYSSIMLGVQEFEPSEAFPISNCLILICGFVTYIACVLDKYEHPKNKFVEYDIAIIFSPSMLLGAKFGTIINKIFSSLLLMFGLIFLLCFTTKKTYNNILKAKAREEKLLGKQMNITNDKSENIKDPFLKSMATANNELEIVSPTGNDDGIFQNRILTDDEKRLLTEDEDPLHWDRIKFIALLEVIVIVDQLIEGSSKLPSFLGIRKCSFFYWVTFLLYVGISYYFIQYSIEIVKEHIIKKKQVIPEFKSEALENVQKNMNFVISMAVIAGIVSSSLGIGGGMITNPMFAYLGLDPKESSSTSNFLIITTAIASTFLFSFAGQLNWSFTICVGIPCALAALCGSFFILQYINRTGRSSILIIIMEYFLVASLIIALWKTWKEIKEEGLVSLFYFHSFC